MVEIERSPPREQARRPHRTPHPGYLKVQPPPKLSALLRAHSQIRLHASLLPLRKTPPFPADPTAEPNLLPAVTSCVPLPSDRKMPAQRTDSCISTLPLRVFPEPEPIPGPSPPCRLSERQRRIARQRKQGFQVCARRLAEACCPLPPFAQGQYSWRRESNIRWESLDRAGLLFWLSRPPLRICQRQGR